jgi:predicted amidohydrolase
MRIAMAQISGTADLELNRKLMSDNVALAVNGDADLVVFPEIAHRRSEGSSEPAAPTAEKLDGLFVSCIRELAQHHKIAVMAGMTERIDGEDIRAYNTVVVIDAAGELIGSYRKIHLFDALGSMESDDCVPGDGSTLVFPFGEHVIGVATCYDLRFPELARVLVDQGANVLVYPSAWRSGPLKEDQWEILLRARAIENVSYVVGVSQAESRHIGRSMTIDPMGVVVSALTEQPGLGFATIDPKRTADARRRNPSLENRRFGVRPLMD